MVDKLSIYDEFGGDRRLLILNFRCDPYERLVSAGFNSVFRKEGHIALHQGRKFRKEVP